eukprot:365246-Chlamydomonas_euryale.AAC.5
MQLLEPQLQRQRDRLHAYGGRGSAGPRHKQPALLEVPQGAKDRQRLCPNHSSNERPVVTPQHGKATNRQDTSELDGCPLFAHPASHNGPHEPCTGPRGLPSCVHPSVCPHIHRLRVKSQMLSFDDGRGRHQRLGASSAGTKTRPLVHWLRGKSQILSLDDVHGRHGRVGLPVPRRRLAQRADVLPLPADRRTLSTACQQRAPGGQRRKRGEWC